MTRLLLILTIAIALASALAVSSIEILGAAPEEAQAGMLLVCDPAVGHRAHVRVGVVPRSWERRVRLFGWAWDDRAAA